MTDSDIAIKVEAVSKSFKLPHEKSDSIKSNIINFWKRQKGYEKQQVLDDVSFEIKKGEFFGIVGRNGSGKSTLLKLLAGIYTPDKGGIYVGGKLVPFIELGVGFNPELSGRENVYLSGALLGFSRKEMEAMYNEIVSFAELEQFMDQKLKNYSSGMQVRLAFSIAIRAQGDILLLDEVLAVGDAAFQQKCYDYFEELKQQKRTVILVSHDMGTIRRFCTKAIHIQKGRITHEGKPIDIADAYQQVNLDSEKSSKKTGKEAEKRIQVKIIENIVKQQKVRFRVSYRNNEAFNAYVGFSLIKDGVTFAELNSVGKDSMAKNVELDYTISTAQFNPGIYEVSAAFFKSSNKQLIAVTTKRAKFTINGYDQTRSGALHLADTWVLKEL